MSEMVERVKAAIRLNIENARVGPDGKVVFADKYELAAKAALEAMRVPTEAMVAAGSFVLEGLTEEDAKRLGEEEHFQSGAWRAEEILNVMIDAALKE